MTIYCRCGLRAHKCTFLRRYMRSGKNPSVGLVAYSKSISGEVNPLDIYVAKFNERAQKWINNGMHEHIHLCMGGDMVPALLSVSKDDMFGILKREDLVDKTKFDANASYIRNLLLGISFDNVMYVFKMARHLRNIYGNICEIHTHTKTSWILTGKDMFGLERKHQSRKECGVLLEIFDIFEKHIGSKILIQLTTPDGSINSDIRYWDITFQISSCGKKEKEENKMQAMLRETIEEIDLDISDCDITEPKNYGVYTYFVDIRLPNIVDYYYNLVKKWTGVECCAKCVYRKQQHGHFASVSILH